MQPLRMAAAEQRKHAHDVNAPSELAEAVASPATCGMRPPAGGVHGAYLGRVPPRLLSAREEGYLVERPHRPGGAAAL